jgi:perosamine synthetase
VTFGSGVDVRRPTVVEELEEDLAMWTGGVSCVAVSGASAALHVAYAAAGLGQGDEVIMSAMSLVDSAATAVAQGARVRFADVEDDTANVDAVAVAAALTSRTRVVTALDYAGHPAEYDDLRGVADAAGLVLVAEGALGGSYRGVPTGGLADLTAFAIGADRAEGGALAVAEEAMLTAARRFRHLGLVDGHGRQTKEAHSFGLDYRLATPLGRLSRMRLRRVARTNARRTELFERYGKLLDDVDGLLLPARRDWVEPAWQHYAVRILGGRRREVYDRMRSAGVLVDVHHAPVYSHPVFADLGYRRGSCPVAERFHAEHLSLPFPADLTDAEQDRIVEALRATLR